MSIPGDRLYDELHKQKIYYHQHQLFLEIGAEGIVCPWTLPPRTTHQQNAAAPDLTLYRSDTEPKWNTGDRRYFNLDKWGMPALVGEISDTTIIHDLNEKKHIYANLGIPEYWVIDIQAQRVFLFVLNTETKTYPVSETSHILPCLSSELLVTALKHLEQEGNTQVAQWFAQQLQQLLTQ